jgi:hypothetical protein
MVDLEAQRADHFESEGGAPDQFQTPAPTRSIRRRPRLLAWLAVGVALGVVLSGWVLVSEGIPVAPPSSNATPIYAASSTGATLAVSSTGFVESPTFWSIAMDGAPNPDQPFIRALLNETPVKSLRYGAAWADETDWEKNCYYAGTIVGQCEKSQESVVDFGNLCKATGDECILGVPAEIDSVSVLASEVNWLKTQTGGWLPTCFSIGDEPTKWTHYGIPWTSWKATDDSTVTASQYASLVERYTDTLRHIDPGACIVGVESANAFPGASTTFITTFFTAVASQVPNVTSLDFHIYPGGKGLGISATTLLGYRNLTGLAWDYNSVAKPNASGIPVNVDEFAPCMSASLTETCPFIDTYAYAAFASADYVQALASGIPRLDFYRLYGTGSNSLVNSVSGAKVPMFYLLSMLQNMSIASVHPVSVIGANPDVFAVEGIQNSSERTMLISNANATQWQGVSESSFVPANWSVQTYYQSQKTGVRVSSVDSSQIFAMGPQSTLLVKMTETPPLTSPPSPSHGKKGGVASSIRWMTPPAAGTSGGPSLASGFGAREYDPASRAVSGVSLALLVAPAVVLGSLAMIVRQRPGAPEPRPEDGRRTRSLG